LPTLPLTEDGSAPHTTIDLRTRLNNKIDNLQPWDYTHFEWHLLMEEPSKYEKLGAVRAGEMCPVYNCHGLTFASRRTQVEETNATITMILEDDGFVPIPEGELTTGDVVIYRDGDGIVQHSGIVLGRGPFNVPRVWSKWGKGFPWVHPLNVSPYAECSPTYYRIKKWKINEVFKQGS